MQLTQNWFEDWFNSPYYPILYKNRDEVEASQFIDRLLDALTLPVGSKIADFACGKGRHAVQLHKRGFNVTGIDLAVKSIEFAKQFECDSLTFAVHDMRNLLTCNYFDAVFNLFTSIGYFDTMHDNYRVIQTIFAALKPNGIGVIDFLNANWVRNNLIQYEEKEVDGILFKIKKEIEDAILFKKIAFTINEQSFNFVEKVQLLTLGDFTVFFEQAGFKLQAVYGNYELEQFDLHHSERLIMVVKKIVSG